MAGPLLIGLLVGQAQAGCEDLAQQVQWAEEEVLEVNPDAARSALELAEEALGCGSRQPPAQLARLFLVDGATSALQGDGPAAADAFAAAARTDAATWIDALGPKMRAQYDTAAAAPTEVGEVDVEAPGWDLLLNGKPAPFPTEVTAGLHIVQVADGDELVFGRVVWVVPGEVQLLTPDLPERAAKPEPVVAVVEPESEPKERGVALSAGIGALAAFGQPLDGVQADGTEVSEPGVKLTLPIELGVVVRSGGAWVRPVVGLAPLVGGRFLFATDEGAGASGFALLADLSAGVGLGSLDVGGAVGIAYPGRIGLRGLAGIGLGDTPLFGELRAGVNVGTGGRVEPAVGLAVSARVP